jgi:multiple sugar transport system ATP-binding protein
MAKVVVNNVDKVYENSFKAVSSASFVAEDKEFVILVGPSGCGKSTTLRMIAGLEEITEGEIFIADRLVNNVPPKDRDIAMVFQNYALYPHMTVYENMSFALKLRKTPKAEIDPIVQEAAKLLEIEDLLQRKPKQLSGGQRQRVALGRAIVRKPKVFLFDEPLSNLDAKLRVQMRAEITRLHRKLATTMIYVTHDQVEAMTMADKIVIMKDGLIHQIDSPLNVYNNPVNLFVAGFIGSPAINQFKGRIEEAAGALNFIAPSFQVPIPPEFKTAIQSHIGKNVIMGLRPEDVYDAEYNTMSEIPVNITALCDVVEPMGNEYVVYLSTGDTTMVARLDPKKLPQVEKDLLISLDMKKVHFFDPDTQDCLTHIKK